MRIGQLSDDISGLANKQKNLGAERKFVRVGRKKPDLTKSSLVNASESVNVEGVGLKANQLRQAGKAPSLTETRQNTKGTPEEFMAAWDTLHPSYGKPTGGEGEAEHDPVRNAVREKIRSLLDENGQLPEKYRDNLKLKLAQAHAEGRALGPDDIGQDRFTSQPAPVKQSAELMPYLKNQAPGEFEQTGMIPAPLDPEQAAAETLAPDFHGNREQAMDWAQKASRSGWSLPFKGAGELVSHLTNPGGIDAVRQGLTSEVKAKIGRDLNEREMRQVEESVGGYLEQMGNLATSIVTGGATTAAEVANGASATGKTFGLFGRKAVESGAGAAKSIAGKVAADEILNAYPYAGHAVQTLLDPNATDADKQSAVMEGAMSALAGTHVGRKILGTAVKAPFKAARVVTEGLGGVGDKVRAHADSLPAKPVQTEIESPTFDREAFTKQLQSQKGPLEVGKGALPEQPNSADNTLYPIKSDGENTQGSHGQRIQSVDDPHGRTRFYESIRRASADHPHGKSVEVKPEQFYQDPSVKLFSSEDGLTGAAVTPDGDLVSVFRHPQSTGDAKSVIAEAANHASSLDAFDINGTLPNLYGQHGFRPVARVQFSDDHAPLGWNFERDGRPEIVLMVRDPEGRTSAPDLTGRNYSEVKDSVPLFTSADFEQAVHVQASAKAMVKESAPASTASTTAEPSTSSPVQTETPKSTLRIGRRSRAVPPEEGARPAQPEVTRLGRRVKPTNDAEVHLDEKPVVLQPEHVKKGSGPVDEGTPAHSTGLANQVNEREAVAGVIESIPSAKGKSAEEWQMLGKDEVDKGADYRALAKQVGDGKSLEPLDVGILTEGKRQLLNEVNKAKATLDAKPGDKKALEKLNQAQVELDQYLKDIQAGKGKASDVFRALQAGTQLDTGSFADVIQAARRTGHSNEKVEAELSKQADEIAGLKEEVERLRANPREHDAKQAVASVRSRRYDRTSLESNIKANREKLSQLRGSGGVGAGKKRGAASVITAEDLKVAGEQIVILKDIALDYARLHVGAPLEDVVSGVKKMLKEDGFDVEDQAIIDALAHTQSRPKSEAAKQLEALRNDAKAGSSSAKAKRLLDEQNALVEAEASKAKQEFKEGERKKLRIAKKQLDYNEASDLKAAKQAIADAEKAEWETVKEAQEAWEKGERLQDGEAKDAYRQWWRTQASILEAQEAIRTGQDIPSRPKESNLTPEQETLKGLRQMAGLKAKLGEAEGQLKTGIRVARVKKPRTVTEEIAELEAQISLKDKRVKQRLTEMEENPTVRRTRKLFKGIQSLKLGSDVGTLRRQGQFFIKHPKIALESVSEAWQAAKSDLAMSKWQDKWDNGKYSDGRSVARVEKESGLLTPDVVTGHEEMVALRWLKQLGGEKLSEASGALERFQKVYINHARKAYFRMNVEAGLNAEALKDVARYTNNVSGRGNLKETGSALSKLAEVVLTSKNYEASRWGTIAEPVRNVARLLQKNKGHEPGWKEGAKSNLKDLAKQTAVMGGAVYLASQMGYKPDKGDWSKLRRYKRDEKGEFTIPTDEVHDWTAGLGPRMRDTIQLMAAAVNPTYRQNIGTELNQILKRTFSAGITTPLAIGSSANQRRLGVKEPINPLTGFKMDEYEDTWKALLPLIAASTAQAENDMGAKAGTFLDEFTGGGVNFYPKEKPKTVSVGRRSSERSRERT